jgi:hypothetical protein
MQGHVGSMCKSQRKNLFYIGITVEPYITLHPYIWSAWWPQTNLLILAGFNGEDASHCINFVPVMAPEALLKDFCRTLQEQFTDYQDLILKAQINAVRRMAGERFALSTGKSMPDQICDPEVWTRTQASKLLCRKIV